MASDYIPGAPPLKQSLLKFQFYISTKNNLLFFNNLIVILKTKNIKNDLKIDIKFDRFVYSIY